MGSQPMSLGLLHRTHRQNTSLIPKYARHSPPKKTSEQGKDVAERTNPNPPNIPRNLDRRNNNIGVDESRRQTSPWLYSDKKPKGKNGKRNNKREYNQNQLPVVRFREFPNTEKMLQHNTHNPQKKKFFACLPARQPLPNM